MDVPARLQQVYELRVPPGIKGGPEPALHDVTVVVGRGHAGEGLAEGADLPQHQGERVDVHLFVVRQPRACLGGHEPLAAGHAQHLFVVGVGVGVAVGVGVGVGVGCTP